MFRDPPHYLKPLTSTTTPKRLLWLACRGYVSRKRDRYEHHFQVAALGSTHWTARTNQRKDSLTTFGDPAALWSEVVSRCPVGRRAVLFTYDLAEQMRLSQMLTCLPAAGWSLDKIVLERTASWCLLRNGKRSLMCCDLRSWCPVPWEKIVADIRQTSDLPELPPAGYALPDAQATYRAMVIRDAVLQILGWIEGENLGQFRPTGSGQGFTAYRRRFHYPKLLVHDDVIRLQDERLAMHTGRSEAWQHGRLTAGPYVEYDLHAAYATIGRDCRVPVVARGVLRKPKLPQLLRAMDRGAVLADATITTSVECVPYGVNERTVWPVGTFRTRLWDPEIKLALHYADKVLVHHAWVYTTDYALRDFCAWVLDQMGNQTTVYGLMPQRVLKHWSRCLIGRFGLRYRAWHDFGPQHPPDVRICTYLDLVDETKTDMLLAGNKAMILGNLEESRESLPQIPGWVMSECRRRLWATMRLRSPGNLVYVDTDSVILKQSRDDDTPKAFTDAFGSTWVRKGVYDRLHIYGPRNLEVGYSRRVSGLPLSARQTAPLEFEGEVMRSVKRSLRTGEINHLVTIPRRFHLEPVDLRRRHNPDGSTQPYEVKETVCLD